jgi:hypothetical protein
MPVVQGNLAIFVYIVSIILVIYLISTSTIARRSGQSGVDATDIAISPLF